MNSPPALSQHRIPSIPQVRRRPSLFSKHAPVPEYSQSPSELTSGFELKAIGNVSRTKTKYLCGDVLDNRFFLIGTSSGLDFIDLSLPTEKQSAKRIVDCAKVKQIKIVRTRKNEGFLLAICGRNSHLRSYTLYSIKVLIFAQLSSTSTTTTSTTSSPASPASPSKRHSKRLSNPFFQSRPKPINHSKRASLQPTSRHHHHLPQDDIHSRNIYTSTIYQHETHTSHDMYTSHDRRFHYERSSIELTEDIETSRGYSTDSTEEFVDAWVGEEEYDEIGDTREMLKSMGIVEELVSVGNNGNTERVSVSVGVKTSVTTTASSHTPSSDARLPISPRDVPQSPSRPNRISISTFSFSSFQTSSSLSSSHHKTADYVKLPHTKFTISFVVSVGVAHSYVAALAKQNIFLFEMSHNENNPKRQQWVHTRTYWLPSTPDYLELAVHGEQLMDIIAAFGNEIVLIGVEDSRIREVGVANEFKLGDFDEAIDDIYAEESTQIWRTFTQLPFLPCVNPENVSDSFTIPPSYALVSVSPPSSFLHPTTVFEAFDTGDILCSGPLLFFATYGTRSMIVDAKGRPFSTIVFEWSYPPLSVSFFRGGEGTDDAYVVGFGKDVIEIRSFRTGLVVENVVRGVEVTYLGSGRSEEGEVILACKFDKGMKGVGLYSLKAPTKK